MAENDNFALFPIDNITFSWLIVYLLGIGYILVGGWLPPPKTPSPPPQDPAPLAQARPCGGGGGMLFLKDPPTHTA